MNKTRIQWVLMVCGLILYQPDVYSGEFEVGDYLFIKAEVISCGSPARLVEVGIVSESRYVVLFNDIEINVHDLSALEVAGYLTDAMEYKTGHRSKTIEVIRVARDDHKSAVMGMMQVYNTWKSMCVRSQKEPYRDWPKPETADQYRHIASGGVNAGFSLSRHS